MIAWADNNQQDTTSYSQNGTTKAIIGPTCTIIIDECCQIASGTETDNVTVKVHNEPFLVHERRHQEAIDADFELFLILLKYAAHKERLKKQLKKIALVDQPVVDLMPPLKPHLKMRQMRCNRKGIGLRIKQQ